MNVWAVILGVPLILLVVVVWLSMRAIKSLKNEKEKEITVIKEGHKKEKKEAERLVKALKNIIDSQDKKIDRLL